MLAGTLSAFLLTGCSGQSSAEEAIETIVGAISDTDSTSGISAEESRLRSLIPRHSDLEDDITEETPSANLSGFCYDQLTDSVKSVYAQLYSGISALKTEFYVNCDATDDIQTALQALLDDHPEFFWSDGEISIYGAEHGGRERITPTYTVDVSSIPQLQAEIDRVCDEFLASVPQEASTYQKLRAAYQYIIQSTDYQTNSPQNQNIQSVFLQHQSVCAGYAKAFQYLLTKLNIPCYYVHGSISGGGETHAWNLVSIDGTMTWVDPTWGDPTYGENEADSARLTIIYDYLCMTDEELTRTGHIPDREYTYPVVTDRTYDFYRMLDDYLEGYDPQTIQEHLYATVNADETITYLKFDSFEAYSAALNGIFGENGLIQEPLQLKMSREGSSSMQYYYSTSDEMLTIKIFW